MKTSLLALLYLSCLPVFGQSYYVRPYLGLGGGGTIDGLKQEAETSFSAYFSDASRTGNAEVDLTTAEEDKENAPDASSSAAASSSSAASSSCAPMSLDSSSKPLAPTSSLRAHVVLQAFKLVEMWKESVSKERKQKELKSDNGPSLVFSEYSTHKPRIEFFKNLYCSFAAKAESSVGDCC